MSDETTQPIMPPVEDDILYLEKQARTAARTGKTYEVNADAIRKWVIALRTGNFKQGKGALCTLQIGAGGEKVPEHCCLGVASEVAVTLGIIPEPTEYKTSSGTYRRLYGAAHVMNYLPVEVAEWLGLPINPELHTDHTTEWMTAAMHNDHGVTFDSIANMIEKMYLSPPEETPEAPEAPE